MLIELAVFTADATVLFLLSCEPTVKIFTLGIKTYTSQKT